MYRRYYYKYKYHYNLDYNDIFFLQDPSVIYNTTYTYYTKSACIVNIVIMIVVSVIPLPTQ